MGRIIKKHKYKIGDTWLNGSIMKKDLGVVVDHRLTVSLQCDAITQNANAVLGPER